MALSVDYQSDATRYWARWGCLILGVVLFAILAYTMSDQGPMHSFLVMVLATGVVFALCSFRLRPRSYRISLDKDRLTIATLPGGRQVGSASVRDVNHLCVRNRGHVLNLALFEIWLRTKQGARRFGPVYLNGDESAMSHELRGLLEDGQKKMG